MSSNEISEINTTSLLPGFGLRVCQLLNVIADKALVACRHSWKPFKYEKVGSADLNAAADDSGAEPFDEVGDEVCVPLEYSFWSDSVLEFVFVFHASGCQGGAQSRCP